MDTIWDDGGAEYADIDEEGGIAWKWHDIYMLVAVGLRWKPRYGRREIRACTIMRAIDRIQIS